jgi:hypothetical protein
MTGGPLAATLARYGAADPYCTPVAGAPTGPRWTRLAAVLDDADLLRSWFDGLAGESHGAPDVAASYLASWLGGTLLDPLGWAVGAERRAWPLDPAALWIHRHEDGWFDGFAVAARQVRVLPADPDAGHPDAVVVADATELRERVASDAVAVLGPLFATVRSFAPYGVRGMWGAVADSLGSSAATAAFRAGRPARPAFEAAMGLVDALVAAGAGRITRPTPEDVRYTTGSTTVVHKGTCCLWYKTTDVSAPIGERYCLSCPLQPGADQHARWVAWLDEEAAARTGDTLGRGSDVEHLTP